MVVDIGIVRCCVVVPDPRINYTTLHFLAAILLFSLSTVSADTESCEALPAFGQSNRAWLRKFVPQDYGNPSPDSTGRVFARPNPQTYQHCTVDSLTM